MNKALKPWPQWHASTAPLPAQEQLNCHALGATAFRVPRPSSEFQEKLMEMLGLTTQPDL